jgi:hypothetical protein
MAHALYSFKVDDDGKVRIGHVFFGANEAAARRVLEEHAEICPKFGPAHRRGDTIELTEELEELPEADEDSLSEFLDLEDDEDEDGEDEEEETLGRA